MQPWIEAGLANPILVDEIYQKFLTNPNSVDSSWYFAFQEKEKPVSTAKERILSLIEAYRRYGYLYAQVNPIALQTMERPPQLTLHNLGFSEEELHHLFPTCELLPKEEAPLDKIISTLEHLYSGRIGYEFKDTNLELEQWLQERIENNGKNIDLPFEQKKMILQQLNRSELLESFIHTKYTGQKRFSIEGGETLIPMIEALIEGSCRNGAQEVVIGMAHRGRLNVLSNILKKSHADIFSEFEESYIPDAFEGSGDVKYHKGFYSQIVTVGGHPVNITLPPNASHLESVDPIVGGEARALQTAKKDASRDTVVPILIHGEAAIAGQGVVYETLQMAQLPGYTSGGATHIVINNQIGFTAAPEETRSTRYCTDIAKTFGCPVFHVNAEDPEACIYATNLAVEIRKKFHIDIFIDLNCYRKYGHNEADEPAYTQPLEYQIIRKKRPIREIYRDQLISRGIMEKDLAESLEKEFKQALQEALEESKEALKKEPSSMSENGSILRAWTPDIATAVSKDILEKIAERLSVIPEGFSIHPKLRHPIQERLAMVKENKPLDWGMAETLAYGTILWDGRHVRLSGQDSVRGTFSHRHAAWIDQQTGLPYFPLNHLKESQGYFEAINSPLSEYAVLGFEYGYSVAYPGALVLWEAQFGDFSNGAQIVMDQYISTSEQKWGQSFGLVLLLPHGYEGQGPEHSSARMERFLTLAGQNNMRIVNPTTPAQIFHLLRKQVLDPLLKPLIVFTPKGLLRHPACISSLDELTTGTFRPIIDDPNPGKKVKRLIFCSGRIYYDLKALKLDDIALIRVEQLYPVETEKLKELATKYSGFEKCIWVQEEPSNMGAWPQMLPLLQSITDKEVQYIGRPRSASPAVGSHVVHKQQLDEILSKMKNE